MNKTILWVIIVIIVVVAAWYFFFRGGETVPVEETVSEVPALDSGDLVEEAAAVDEETTQ